MISSRKKESQATHAAIQWLIYFLHVFVLLSCALYDSSLNRRIRQQDALYCFSLAIMISLEFFMMRSTSKNPGYVAFMIEDGLDEELTDRTFISSPFSELVLEHKKSKSNLSQFSFNNSWGNNSNFFSSNIKFPKKRYCDYCNIEQPYRTKHCRRCEACVAKYDHHCYFIGTCIGEQNLGRFYLMLLVINITYFWLLLIVN